MASVYHSQMLKLSITSSQATIRSSFQDDGLVIGDISKAHKSVYNLLGISGESTILYDYSVFRLEALK